MVIKSSVFHYLLHRLSPGKLVDQLIQLAHLQNAKSESRRSRRIQAFRLTSAKYEIGQTGITEFNEAKARYLEAASNCARARYEQLYQTRLLDCYRGRALTF